MSSPFDKTKYKALLEGLEIVELKLSFVRDALFRIDSEFYKKEYLSIVDRLKSLPFEKLEKIVSRIQHPTEIIRVYEDKGIQILLSQNVRNNRFDFSAKVFMHLNTLEALKENKLNYDDVALTRSGANYGQSACFKDSFDIYSCADLLVLKHNNSIKGGYLSTFLNTYYGKKLLDRGAYGMAQPHIAPNYLKNFPVARFSKIFENRIDELIVKSFETSKKLELLYVYQELQLLKDLGFENWQPTEETKAIKKFSESFEITGRLDAEFYQPKYDEVVKKIKKQKYKKLDDLVTIKKSIEPGSEAYQTEGISFYRVSDVSKYGLSQPEIFLDRREYEKENLKPKKDTILFSKDGSIGIAYKVEEDIDGITSGALLHLSIKDNSILPDYLTLVLNSKLIQMQAERDSGGSIIQHWRVEEIKNVLIPIVEFEKQKEISQKVKESFKNRKQSQHLLHVAKKAVEIAIEQNEKEAEKFIKENNGFPLPRE